MDFSTLSTYKAYLISQLPGFSVGTIFSFILKSNYEVNAQDRIALKATYSEILNKLKDNKINYQDDNFAIKGESLSYLKQFIDHSNHMELSKEIKDKLPKFLDLYSELGEMKNHELTTKANNIIHDTRNELQCSGNGKKWTKDFPLNIDWRDILIKTKKIYDPDLLERRMLVIYINQGIDFVKDRTIHDFPNILNLIHERLLRDNEIKKYSEKLNQWKIIHNSLIVECTKRKREPIFRMFLPFRNLFS